MGGDRVRSRLRARAARACSRLVAAGGRTYGRVAVVTRGAAHRLAPPMNAAAANFRLIAKLPSKLPRPKIPRLRRRVSVGGGDRKRSITPTKEVSACVVPPASSTAETNSVPPSATPPSPPPPPALQISTPKQMMPSSPPPYPSPPPAGGVPEYHHSINRGRLPLQGSFHAAVKAVTRGSPHREFGVGMVRTVTLSNRWTPPYPRALPSVVSPFSRIVTTDRDIMKKELKKVTRERDEAIKGLTAHQQDQPANYAFPFPGTLTKHSSSSDKSLSMSRDYESLKMQCEKAMAEVQGLLKQNVDITRKYENTLKEVDYYKKQERAAYTALQNLRMQYEEVVAEKQKLEREVTSLQTIMEDDRKEIADLRRQQQVSNLLVRAFSIVDGASQN